MSDISLFILCAGVFAVLIAPLAALDVVDDPVARFGVARRARLRVSRQPRARPPRRVAASARARHKPDRQRAA